MVLFLLCTGIFLPPLQAADTTAPTRLRTVAEASGYTRTARYDQVLAYCQQLARQSQYVHLDQLGTSVEGRELPLLILSKEGITSPQAARKAKKLVVLVIGNIHAGEVAGKEALLRLARELGLNDPPKLLDHLVVLVAPIFNADGNERMAPSNRPGQNGPERMGERANAQGLDLNRDFVKLESSEVRALVQLLNTWDPAVFIDTHTTNGSRHRYTLTYDGPRHPASPKLLIEKVRDSLLPAIEKNMANRNGYRGFYYGNFVDDHQAWDTYPALPRYGVQYMGLRNRIGILAEAYAYASYKDRVLASRDFVHACLETLAAESDSIHTLIRAADQATIEAGKSPRADRTVPLRAQPADLPEPFTVRGYAKKTPDTPAQPKDYTIPYRGATKTIRAVPLPYAYLIPAELERVIQNLQRHGIKVEELREDIALAIERYQVDQLERALRPFQKHRIVQLEATPQASTERIAAGMHIVRTGQPLGQLAAYLLEPEAVDGLVAWNFLDRQLAEGQDYPILRLPQQAFLTTDTARTIPETERKRQSPTLKDLRANRLPNLRGNATRILTWLDDGEHFLQRKDNTVVKVHARTGQAEPYLDEQALTEALTKLPKMKARNARAVVRSALSRLNPQRSAFLFTHHQDLFHVDLKSLDITRLTHTPKQPEQQATFSPDGQQVAFVRENNLFTVPIANPKEQQLTKDGNDVVSNGRADWVYYEEINLRDWNAFWWSPDSHHLAFLRFDDTPVSEFTLVDPTQRQHTPEVTRYPNAGEANPLMQLGIVPASGGTIRWVEPPTDEDHSLIAGIGWIPDGQALAYHTQDRSQTRMDAWLLHLDQSSPQRLLRDRTKAWISAPQTWHFLGDGSFILASERSGWNHLYHIQKGGSVCTAITRGEWDVRSLAGIDEKTGQVFFTATRDAPLGVQFYKVKLDGSDLMRLTEQPGTHRVQLNPTKTMYIDTWSNSQMPTKVNLVASTGERIRRLDTNPVHALEQVQLVTPEFVQIPTPDGFMLEGMIIDPPDREPGRKYPVWLRTYAGPQAPSTRDSWSGGRVLEQVLANAGFVVFVVDPRSASGKGAGAAWTAYRQLGIQELKDLETAVDWLCQRPYVDAKRVGLSGHSYGGFMTSFALTHSKHFAAGVAGAPVTDWRNYDTIYTERYMDTPKNNPKGYDATSVVKAAKNLHGRLLLVHGMMDDNVHVQNTMQLAEALQKAGKNFELMIYPRARHGIPGTHYRNLTIDFMMRHLLNQ